MEHLQSARSPSGGQGISPARDIYSDGKLVMRDGHFVHENCCYARDNDRCEHWIFFERLWRQAHARAGVTQLTRELAAKLRRAGRNVTSMSLRAELAGRCSPIRSAAIPLYTSGDELDRIISMVADEVAAALEGGDENGRRN